MNRRIFLFLAATFCSSGQDKKTKNPELRIVEATVRRVGEGMIAVDGTVENTSAKTYNKMLLKFEFFAPGNKSIVIQKGPTDATLIPPGESAEFHLQLRAPARAVEVSIEAADGSGRELRVEGGGPFPID